MKTYCYIRNGVLTETSDKLITKHIAPVSMLIDEEGVIVREAVPGISGMIYDQVIETTLEGRVEYKGGKIVKYIEPAPVIDPKTKAIEYIQNTPASELVPVSFKFTDKEIGDIITDKSFAGNTNAQLASLMKGQVKMLALFCQNPLAKPSILALFAEDIAQIREISKVRVATGLSPIDLSFLD